MSRFGWRCPILIFPFLAGLSALAQQSATHVEETTVRKSTRAIAPIGPQKLFGGLPLSTSSIEARKFVEAALDKYENHQTDDAEAQARRAIDADSHFALAYATLSLASLSGIPNTDAAQKAKLLMFRATPDEQLLIRWMTSISDRDLLPAISAMNDLMARYPKDEHILYLIADWLYYQQDYDRARQMLETIHQLSPHFPPALNLLAYSCIQSGTPCAKRAVVLLKHYAEVQPHSPNPEDSLGEILRYTGDDAGSLEHYAKALKIDPTFISSQWGLGDTAALMGDYKRARIEFDCAIAMAKNPRDRFHAEYQKTLVYFWEGQPAEGRKAFDALYARALEQKEPYSIFEIGFGRALLAADTAAENEQLQALETALQKPVTGISDMDRNSSLALVLRERARTAALQEDTASAEDAIQKLEQLAARSQGTLIENSFDTAKGYLRMAEGDFDKAATQLAADPRSLFALSQLAEAQEELGDADAATFTRTRIKFLRSPTAEWYLINRAASTN
jgi:tetratricopeptide (TPR) repeat protein